MKKAKKTLKISIVSLLLIFTFTGGLRAGSLWEQQGLLDEVGQVYEEGKNPTDIRIRVIKIINTVLTLLGIITVIIILYGGFRWMTSAGNEEAVKDAKNILKNGVIGLIIIAFAWSVTRFVLIRLSPKYIEHQGYYYEFQPF